MASLIAGTSHPRLTSKTTRRTKMAIDLEARLKSYAIVHLETVVKKYNARIDNWKAYLNLAADAQTACHCAKICLAWNRVADGRG
jgi:hypothetical protein